MRQLKGKVKETPAQKRERKKEFRENKENLMKIAVPAVIIAALVVILIVYVASSRSKPYWTSLNWDSTFIQPLLVLAHILVLLID